MIVSASYRTDIPAFYRDWFLNRLAAGETFVANPYGGKPNRVDLRPEAVTGYVFWTRNPKPFLPALEAVSRQGVPFCLQVTVLDSPDWLDRSVPPATRTLPVLRSLRDRYGPKALVWRYDPIVLTDRTDAAWHKARFSRLAAQMSGLTDEVTVSFMEPYRKTLRNLRPALQVAGAELLSPGIDEKQLMLRTLSWIAGEHGIRLTLCTQPQLADLCLPAAACVDVERLSEVAGRPLRARRKGNRPGCRCAESRDIGAYDGCAQGCAYCYAVSDREKAIKRVAAHDPHADRLG